MMPPGPPRNRVLRACLIGPECTGKTTLAADLAGHFGTVWVPEYAREYAIAAARALKFEDADPIGRGQAGMEARFSTGSEQLLILDTDLVSTLVYSRYYYGAVPDWLPAEAQRRLADLYLLFDWDVPFVADAARDTAEHRPAQFELFAETLAQAGARVVVVRGGWDERRSQAVRAIREMLERED